MTGGAGFGVPGAAAGGPAALGGIQEMDEEDDDDDGALLILPLNLSRPSPCGIYAGSANCGALHVISRFIPHRTWWQ